MSYFLAPTFGIGYQGFTSQGIVNAGGLIYTYLAGSTTLQATYQDPLGATPNQNPIVLTSAGCLPAECWLIGGQSYKFVVQDQYGNAIGGAYDNVYGINDNSSSYTQWIASGYTPTYLSATSFSVVGVATAVFQIGRRIQSTNTSGFVYSTVIAASYSGGTTTITVLNDSTGLDSGMSNLNVGILTATHGSSPIVFLYRPAFSVSSSAVVTGTSGLANFVNYSTILLDTVNGFTNGVSVGYYTIPITGIWQINATVTVTNTGGTQPSSWIAVPAGASLGGETPFPGIAGTQYIMSSSGISSLTQGTLVYMRITPGNTAYTSQCNSFSGSLIG